MNIRSPSKKCRILGYVQTSLKESDCKPACALRQIDESGSECLSTVWKWDKDYLYLYKCIRKTYTRKGAFFTIVIICISTISILRMKLTTNCVTFVTNMANNQVAYMQLLTRIKHLQNNGTSMHSILLYHPSLIIYLWSP